MGFFITVLKPAQALKRLAGGYGRAESGVAMIEFALILIPVLYTLLFCLEIGVRFAISANLNSAATGVIRFIQYWNRDVEGFGAYENQIMDTDRVVIAPQEDLLFYACREMSFVLPCNEDVVNVQVRASGIGYQVRLIYKWNSLLPGPSGMMDLVLPDDVETPEIFVIPRNRIPN